MTNAPEFLSRHCVTCSDEGVIVRVVGAGSEPGAADCRDQAGHELVVNVELVDAVRCGDELLVHAGVALRRFPGAEPGRGVSPEAASRFPFSEDHWIPNPRNY